MDGKPARISFVFIQSIADERSIDLASHRFDEIYGLGFSGDEFIKERTMIEGSIMICQRCGFCCHHLDVMIINPRSIRPDGTIDPEDQNSMIKKPRGRKCPHLAYLGDVAVCTIHDLPCYRGTPCDLFDQIGPEDGVCILKSYFKSSDSVEL